MRYLPFISYSWAEWHSLSWHNSRSRNEEVRQRLWSLVKYVDPETKKEHTTEGRVILEYFPDFCGGMIVHSPQVHTYTRQVNPWDNGRETVFMNPGPSPKEIGLDFEFSALDKDPLRAVDLSKLTDKLTTQPFAEEFMWKSMAQSVITSALALGKCGIIAADKTNSTGKMSRLVEYMEGLGWIDVPMRPPVYGVKITDTKDANGNFGWTTGCRSSMRTEHVRITKERTDPWRNRNSGNMVQWLPMYIESEKDDHECWESTEYGSCDCDVGIGTQQLDPHVTDVYGNRDFVRGAPRNFWRNG